MKQPALLLRTPRRTAMSLRPPLVPLRRLLSTPITAAGIPKLADAQDIVEALRKRTPRPVMEGVRAMYSSALGAVVTEPSLMGVPIDDHGFHRGHAVFDTCNVRGGMAYGIDMHLQRLLSSAEMARIEVSFSAAELKDILLATLAAAGKKDNVFCRYWLTAGRGDFHVSPKGCQESSFYAVVHDAWERDPTAMVKEIVVNTPLKPKLLANMKSNNYMINALSAMEAEDQGGNLGLQVDAKGYLQEASISCVAIVEADGVMRTPMFDSILPSTTVRRSLDLGSSLVESGLLKGIDQTQVPIENVYAAKEVILLGGHHVSPVGQVGEHVIADGQRGPVCAALQELQDQDMANPKMLDAIPFHLFE